MIPKDYVKQKREWKQVFGFSKDLGGITPRSPRLRTHSCIPLLLFTFLLGACARSPQYRHEEDSGLTEAGNAPPSGSYYGDGNRREGGTDGTDSLGQPRKRLVVFDFWNDSPVKHSTFGSFAAQEIQERLGMTQKVILLPNELKSQLATEDFVQGDKIRMSQLLREGRRLGVSVVVIGKISKITFRQEGDEVGLFRQRRSMAKVDMEAKIFDVQGGREVFAFKRSGEALTNNLIALEGSGVEDSPFRIELTQEAIRNACEGMTTQILTALEKIGWQGRIARTSGTKVYINAGRASGLMSGDILKVMKPGEEIYDPNSGAFLGRSQGQLKGTLEVVDFLGPDSAIADIHTGGNFREGDVVELY